MAKKVSVKKSFPKFVVVRSSQSGVWLGELQTSDPSTKSLILSNGIRAYSWEGAASCSGLAVRGPRGGKLCEAVATAHIFDVVEILSTTDEAVVAWKAVTPWKA